MIDFICPRCGDFSFEDFACIRCVDTTAEASRQPVDAGYPDPLAAA